MVLFRGRPGAGMNLGPVVNSPANEQEPTISPRGDQLLFASPRPGSILAANGQPSLEIWISWRTKERPR